MKLKSLTGIVLLLLLSACGTRAPFDHTYASGHYVSPIESCVPYARRVSGLQIYGDADRWWQLAPPRYRRGTVPEPGAVLVLKATPQMRSGHVAVVKNISAPRQIMVTHSNWGNTSSGRHIIYDRMLAEDVSPANDWSSVRFWNDEKNVLGFPYAAYGFIYP